MDSNLEDLLRKWADKVRRAQAAHYDAATRFERLNLWLGVPVTILSTLVGTSVFATLQKEVDFKVKIAVGAASVLAAILAASQTFLRFSERAAKHHASAMKYAALKREIDYINIFPPSEDKGAEFAASFLERWTKLNEESPTIPKRISDRYYTKKNPMQEDDIHYSEAG